MLLASYCRLFSRRWRPDHLIDTEEVRGPSPRAPTMHACFSVSFVAVCEAASGIIAAARVPRPVLYPGRR